MRLAISAVTARRSSHTPVRSVKREVRFNNEVMNKKEEKYSLLPSSYK